MAYTQEQIEKAKTAGTVEELIAIAKTEGIELSEEKAATLYAELRAEEQELSDEELDNVAGGTACDETECKQCHTANSVNNVHCTNCGAALGNPKRIGL